MEDDSGIRSGEFVFIMPPDADELTDEDSDNENSDYEDDCDDILNESQLRYGNQENSENDPLQLGSTSALFLYFCELMHWKITYFVR